MSPRRALAIGIATAAALATLAAGASARPRVGRARLQGTFALSGRVTVAVHVNAEHRGQLLTRTWSFTPLCPAGSCARVRLMRQRAGGTDTLTLQRVTPGYYLGQGRFAAPLGCDGQVYASGETVRFTITVRIKAASSSSSGLIASRIKATYTNRVRINGTTCVFPPSRDAAVYRGTLQSATPTAVTPAPIAPAAAATGSGGSLRHGLSALSPAGS